MKRVLALTFAGAALAAVTATPASAAGPICRDLTVGTDLIAHVCLTVTLGASGTTVTPSVTVECRFWELITDFQCTGNPVEPGTFGFVPSPSLPTPVVDPATGSVKSSGGTIGTLYLGSSVAPVPLVFPPFCVGDPTFCHS